jgi:anaerobic dimethyl sulfoxide reductase subunit B (iron-sulfur subunit)
MPQYGFFFDQSRCVDCRTCAVACKDWNDLPPGPVKWLRMFNWEKSTFTNIRVNMLFAPCYHCENPVCVDAANGAMFKEPKYGAVLIDPAKATSIDLRKAQDACPYGAIQFDSDAINATASKCTMCIDRLEQNLLPVCVEACPMRALDFGPLQDIISKYGSNRDLEDVPSGATVNPAVIFKPKDVRKQFVPYDANYALQLLAKRDPLPAVFSSPSDVTDVPEGMVGRSKLVMKPRNADELMQTTRNDDG